MKETIDKAETLNVIRSFISSLRPEATGLINDIYDAVNHLPSAQPKATDLISRQSAIRAMAEAYEDTDAEWILRKLPSAQPERKKGKWTIKNGELAFWDVCSECGRMVIHKAPFYNFCPNCGADMRGDSHEID